MTKDITSPAATALAASPGPGQRHAGRATGQRHASPPGWIDIGINLAHDSFDPDRDAVMARAAAAGVVQMVVTGSSGPSTQRALELSRASPGQLFATAGVHPHHAVDLDQELLERLSELATAPEVVAIGECGLDYFRNFSPPARQQQAFHQQLELASRLRKPVFLHQRDAHADFLAILREHRAAIVGGVAHCFTGDAAQLTAYLDLGLAIGITGWICDERRGAHLLPMMRSIPADRLLLETDGPYLLPRDLPTRPPSRRNEPAYLPHIAATVARARGDSLEQLSVDTLAATRKLFHLPDPDSVAAGPSG